MQTHHRPELALRCQLALHDHVLADQPLLFRLAQVRDVGVGAVDEDGIKHGAALEVVPLSMPYTDRVIASTPPSDERSARFLGPAGRARAQECVTELHGWLGSGLGPTEEGASQT